MTESVKLLATLFWIAIPAFVACWVWQDAHRLKKNGADITPTLWAALVFLLWLVSFPLYLYLRWTTWRPLLIPSPTTETAAQGAGQHQLAQPGKVELRVLYWVGSVSVAVALSMYATWVAINRYPVPDSDAVNLGIFLFFLIGLVALVVIVDLVVSGLREGKRLEMGLIAGILVGGLSIATVVGLSIWGIGWFIPSNPGDSGI